MCFRNMQNLVGAVISAVTHDKIQLTPQVFNNFNSKLQFTVETKVNNDTKVLKIMDDLVSLG